MSQKNKGGRPRFKTPQEVHAAYEFARRHCEGQHISMQKLAESLGYRHGRTVRRILAEFRLGHAKKTEETEDQGWT